MANMLLWRVVTVTMLIFMYRQMYSEKLPNLGRIENELKAQIFKEDDDTLIESVDDASSSSEESIGPAAAGNS